MFWSGSQTDGCTRIHRDNCSKHNAKTERFFENVPNPLSFFMKIYFTNWPLCKEEIYLL